MIRGRFSPPVFTLEYSMVNKKREKREMLLLHLYLIPALVFFICFKYWPILYSFILSLFNWNFVTSMKWVGLFNYAEMFKRPAFWLAIHHTILYIVGLFPFFVIIPLFAAVILTNIKPKRMQNVYKALFFIPAVLAFAIICIVWMWIFNPSFGVFNTILRHFGFNGYSWLNDKRTALPSIILVSGWKQMGASMLLFEAGLMTISHEYEEAARIDGANAWQIFWKIKWPLLTPTAFYIITTSIIFASDRAFTPINVLTKGGPAEATTNLAHIIYLFAFNYFNSGLASATAIFTSIFFFIITIGLMRLARRFSYYEN